jgi:hypothetical protein
MARPSLLDVINEANVSFADNINGAITPLKLRTWIGNLVAAIRPAYGYLSRVAVWSQTPPTGTPVGLTFDTGTVSPVVDYDVSGFATGTIVRNEHGVTRFTLTADVAPTANANNTLTFTLYKNGVATAWKQSVMLTATGVTESVTFSGLEYLNGLASYSIRISATAAVAMNFSNASFVLETVPVWEYT